LLEAIAKLEGFEAPAIEWEKSIFPSRVANYDPRWLDHLCLSGVVGWGRVSPHPAFHEGNGQCPRRVIPTNASPITFYVRDTSAWLDYALRAQRVEDGNLVHALTPNALNIWELLKKRGACFAEEIQRVLGVISIEVQHALWELASAGLAAADGFDQLRAMIDSDRRQAAHSSYRKTRSAAGRWSLFGAHSVVPEDAITRCSIVTAWSFAICLFSNRISRGGAFSSACSAVWRIEARFVEDALSAALEENSSRFQRF
jgi:ATP-dependent Lhr-like helicase